MIKKILTNILKLYGYELKKNTSPDIYIVSFPKSGRTWLNLLLGNYFEQYSGLNNLHPDTLLNLNLFHNFFQDIIPAISFTHDNNTNFYLPAEKLKSNIKKYKNSKVVFLVRDPRDVLISSYFEKTKRIKLGKREKGFWEPFKGSISDYVYEKNGGFETIIRFYNIWEKNKSVPKDFLLLKYEELHTDTEKEFEKLLHFIGIKNINKEFIKKSVDAASFSNMQKIEKKGGTKSDKLKPADVNDVNSYKTRKGKIGDYKNHFSAQEIEYLNKKMQDNLSPFFGYNI